MHSILLASKWPGTIDPDKQNAWSRAVSTTQELAEHHKTGVQMLGRGVWLIRDKSAIAFLGDATAKLRDWQVEFDVLVIDSAEAWTDEQPSA